MIATKLHTQITLAFIRHDQLIEIYRDAAAQLRRALLGVNRAAKWRATVKACDAEHELIGDCGGPFGAIYERLGIHDCYEVPEEGSESVCAAYNPGDPFCRNECAIIVQIRRRPKASPPAEPTEP